MRACLCCSLWIREVADEDDEEPKDVFDGFVVGCFGADFDGYFTSIELLLGTALSSFGL